MRSVCWDKMKLRSLYCMKNLCFCLIGLIIVFFADGLCAYTRFKNMIVAENVLIAIDWAAGKATAA